jgi:filamentous hemagglutinin family protein
MLSLRKQATKMIRGSKNSHRFICFINGKIRSFCTSIEDIDSQVAALFGALNNNLVPQTVTAGALLMMALAMTPSAYALDPLALPTGYQSVSGNHQFDQSSGVLNVTTGANSSIVNYASFNIGSQAHVNFNLPSANASILNRVVGGGMSEIYGSMTSNGRVFLVNPAGIFFGNGANVSVNGLLASTLGIGDQKYLAGQYEFVRTTGSAPGTIQIDPNAKITIGNSGSATFLASSFANYGSVNAPGGTIQIGVGDRISLGTDLIGITVTESLKETLQKAAILNAGSLSAAQVKAIASTLKQDVLDTIVNNTGRISANKVVDGPGGIVELIADNGLVNNSGIIDASGTNGGNIVLHGQSSQNSGQLLAMGSQGAGGEIDVLGSDAVSLIGNAVVDVSGQTGSGTALIGGDYKGGNPLVQNSLNTFVDDNVQIRANALNSGDGGKVIVWGDQATGFYGNIQAQGGLNSGNGGFVETSGKDFLDMQGSVDASARSSSGLAGSWLLDPRDVIISNNNTNNSVSFYDLLTNTTTYSPTSLLNQVSNIKVSSINTALNLGTDVVVSTGNYGNQPGDIHVQGDILKSSGGFSTLKLFAANDLFIDSNGSIKSTSNNPLQVFLKADNDIYALHPSDGNGSITLNGDINLKNGDLTISGQSIALNKMVKTSDDITLSAMNGNITLNTATGSISGDHLTADANGLNHAIGLRNSDFNTVKLTTDSGKIDYTDTDGVTATAQVSNSAAIANVTTGASGSASNGQSELSLIISGVNLAKELNFNAKSGSISMLNSGDSASAEKVSLIADNGGITQQAGSFSGSTSVSLKATSAINQSGGTMQGASLTAQASGAGQAIAINNADFGSVSLNTNNGKIDYADRDGVSTTVNAGTNQANVTTFASGVTANNSSTEADLIINGLNSAKDLNLTAKQDNITLASGSSANATNNATLIANAGSFSESGGSLSATNTLSINANGITQSGGSMSGHDVSLTANTSAINQTGGSMQGSSLTAQANGSGQAITLNNADFTSAKLVTNNGQIAYSDTDGVSVTANAGNSQASVTTFATGATANNSHAEADLALNGSNSAKDLNLTAKNGNITLASGSSASVSNNATLIASHGGIMESGGSLSAINTLKLDATGGDIQQTGGSMNASNVTLTAHDGKIAQTGGDLTGRDLQATTLADGKSIEIDHADFKTAQLSTHNGNVQYSDTDGVSVNVNAGTADATIQAETGGNLNGNSEAGIILTGNNGAHSLNLTTLANSKSFFNPSAGDISQASGSSVAASNLSVTTNVGNVKLDNANANDVDTLSAASKGGNVSYQDKNSVTLGSVNLNSDHNGSKGDLSIQAHGLGNITQNGAVVGVNTLTVQTDSGNVHLDNNGNDANNLSASSRDGSVVYHDANDINILGVNLDTNNHGAVGDLTLQANGNGNITQSGTINQVNTLSLTTDTGNAFIIHALNNARNLEAKSNGGTISYRDLDDINIKSANLDQNNSGTRGNLSIQTSSNGNITQSGAISGVDTLKLRTDSGDAHLQLANNVNKLDAGSNSGLFQFTNAKSFTLTGANMNLNNAFYKGDLDLTATSGTISQNTAINANELKVTGNAQLTNANNTVDVFSAHGNDITVSFTDKNGFNLGESNVGTGTLNLSTVSGNINQDEYSPFLAFILQNRNITNNGGLTAGTLNLNLGYGASARLTDACNKISNFYLSGNSSHTELVDNAHLTITGANDNNGILETTLLNGHSLDQSAGIVVKGLKVTMDGGGDFTLNNAGNDVQILSANATGWNTGNTQGSFVDGNGGFQLAASDMHNGDLSLEARNGGNITQANWWNGTFAVGALHADELKLTLVNGGEADFSTQANRVNVLSANAESSQPSWPIFLPEFKLSSEQLVLPGFPIGFPTINNTGKTQVLFRNDKDLNLAQSNLDKGDLKISLRNGSSLNQDSLQAPIFWEGEGQLSLLRIKPEFAQSSHRDITSDGGVHANELSVTLHDGGSANLTTQHNTVDVFAARAKGENTAGSVVAFSNAGNLNLAQSNVGHGQLIISAEGNIDNQNLGDHNRDITHNDSTLKGDAISLRSTGNGSIDLYNDVKASNAVSLTTANASGGIYIHSGTNVESPTGSVYINSNRLTLDGTVQGQLVQIWPWNLTLSMGLGGAPGSMLLSQNLIDHINNDPTLGLNTIMFGHQTYGGTIVLGTLNLSNHPNTDVAFNAPRVLDSTPNNDSTQNLIMAANRSVYLTAGADKVANWASAPGGVQYGDNRSFYGDLDIKVSGSGLIYVHLLDYTGVGNSHSIFTGGGNRAFVNAQDENNSGSLKNLASALSARSSSLIINQIKGSTLIMPGNPVDNQPTAFGSIRPVSFIPNQSL